MHLSLHARTHTHTHTNSNLHTHTHTHTRTHTHEFHKQIDQDGNKEIEFEEFVNIMAARMKETDLSSEILSVTFFAERGLD